MSTITVVHLKENLLRCLAEDLVEKFHKPADPLSLAKVTVILPHRRGTLYLRHYLLEIINGGRGVADGSPKPLICPRLITIEDFTSEVAVTLEDEPGRALSLTDQAWLLFGLVRELGLYKDVASTWDRFFRWGVRLAGLLDEIDREMVDPKDIVYPENVPAQARVLLERLRDIHAGFTRVLGKHGFTTEGKRFRLVAERISKTALPTGPIYLAGFYAMSRSEDRLFRQLFERGAEIFWQADPDDLPDLYQRWQKEWGVDIKVRETNSAARLPAGTHRTQAQLHFHEAYDLHAEMRRARQILSEEVHLPDQCALVLPDPAALIAALYHIPEQMSLNVSMGYPLERTSVATLFEELLTLDEGRSAEGAYYCADYLGIIRHPYVRRLATPRGKEGRLVLHLVEQRIRGFGKPYLTRDEIVGLFAASGDSDRQVKLLATAGLDLEEARAHLAQLDARLLAPWQDVKTPRDLATAVRNSLRFLLLPFLGAAGSPQPWLDEAHALDNEFIYALEDQVLPSLEDALFARQKMRKELLFSLLRDLIHMARVPFEGRPLKGLQVLGLLESRLLSFDKVIVIDVNEGVVPAFEEVNPLLPELLRRAAGLPSREKEEAITSYHFDRLIGSAKEVHLVWQSSTSPSSSGLEGKKTRSRFVEALLWQEEREAGRLLDEVVKREVLAISPKALSREEGLAKTAEDAERLEKFIRSHGKKPGLSATLLSTYLTCPLRFYYEYLLELEQPAAPSEDVDSGELGMMVHKALETYFRPFKGKPHMTLSQRDGDKLVSIFTGLYKQADAYRALSPEKRFFLEHTVEHRLRTYLRNMSVDTVIESLEQEYRTSLATAAGEITLYGKVDRIDSRDGASVILDYKTGWIDAFGGGHFEKRLAGFELPDVYDYDALRAVKEAAKDIQLPLYVLLACRAAGKDPAQTLSAYVELRDKGQERFFVTARKLEAVREDYAAWFADGFPRLLAYLIDHILKSPCFYAATDEEACSRCDFSSICSFAYA